MAEITRRRMGELVRPPRRTRIPAPPSSSVGRVPKGPVVDRAHFLVEEARGKRVIDLGFAEEARMAGKLERRTWLHEQIAEVAEETIGIDANEAGVEEARRLGFTAVLCDCQDARSLASLGLEPADVVIAGELIEHLERPGDFLDGVANLVAEHGELVVTTPNPLSLTNALLGLTRREVQNVEHVGWHSWRTLDALLGRHGWSVRRLAFYRHPYYVPTTTANWRERARVAAFNTYQAAAWPLYAFAPALADGLIVVAAPNRAADIVET